VVTAAPIHHDRARIAELTAREGQCVNEATPPSGAMYELARRSMTNRVPSSYQARKLWPIFLAEGAELRVLETRRAV
jgi:hypothetical protein